MDKLPDFVIVGCMKGGTNSLYFHLQQHPAISMACVKETHFFTRNWNRGVCWYKSHFIDVENLCGEATPAYIYLTQFHKRMHHTIPHAKLIVVLRNPVTRAYSQWNHMKNKWYARKTFEEVVQSDLENMKCEGRLPAYEDVLQRGFYIDQIESLLRFYSRERLHIVISENLKTNVQKECDQIFRFLGLNSTTKLDIRHGIHKRVYDESMSTETAELLREIYRTYNARLFSFLGHDISAWDDS